MTGARIGRVVAALGETEGQSVQDVVIPLMRHTFAREYGWSYRETDALTLKRANQALVLMGEDMRRREENGI